MSHRDGLALRSLVYHEILSAYLNYVKARGYTSMFIWACPPMAVSLSMRLYHPQHLLQPCAWLEVSNFATQQPVDQHTERAFMHSSPAHAFIGVDQSQQRKSSTLCVRTGYRLGSMEAVEPSLCAVVQSITRAPMLLWHGCLGYG